MILWSVLNTHLRMNVVGAGWTAGWAESDMNTLPCWLGPRAGHSDQNSARSFSQASNSWSDMTIRNPFIL